MSDLVVRCYNVGFGDAVLVSIPELSPQGHRETVRHVLFDVGNLLAGTANTDEVFTTVVADIAERTDGEVDLYVMTHEHLDHVQGLLSASDAGVPLTARYAWLTGSSAPDYYETHPESKKRRLDLRLALEDAVRVLEAEPDPWLEMMVRNNSTLLPDGALGLRTSAYVDHLRTLTRPGRTFYVDRTTGLSRRQPFREATLRILAPEEATSAYYGRASFGGSLTAVPPEGTAASATAPAGAAASGLVSPPVGVSPGAFFDLVTARRRTTVTRILEIDAANNNTSVVVEIEWRGWRLLFPGDAEIRSWQTMFHEDLLRPAHFVKVAHHGSHNGTYEELFDRLMPPVSPDGRPRHAVVSTHDGSWDSVPDPATLATYASRCELHDTREVERGTAVEVRFPG